MAGGAGLDDKAVCFQHGAKFPVARAVLGIEPGDQYTGWRQKMNEPIQSRLECIDRVLAPIKEGHIVLAVRQATSRRRCDAAVASAMEVEHEFGALRTGDDDPVMLRAPCEPEHRLDDSLAGRRETGLDHGVSPICPCLNQRRVGSG